MESIWKNVAMEMMQDVPKVRHNGLVDGKAGIAAFLYELAVQTQNIEYEDVALRLLENALSKVQSKGFGCPQSELAGIGWAVNFLTCHAGIKERFAGKLPDLEFLMFNGGSEVDEAEDFPLWMPALYLLSKGEQGFAQSNPCYLDSLFNRCTFEWLAVRDKEAKAPGTTNAMLHFLTESRKRGVRAGQCEKLIWRILSCLAHRGMRATDTGNDFVLGELLGRLDFFVPLTQAASERLDIGMRIESTSPDSAKRVLWQSLLFSLRIPQVDQLCAWVMSNRERYSWSVLLPAGLIWLSGRRKGDNRNCTTRE